MEEGRNTVGGIMHQPVLHSHHLVADVIGVARLLESKLREVSDTIGNQFTTFHRVEIASLVEEVVHIHTPQLGDALFLRHLLVEFIYLLFHVRGSRATSQKCGHAYHYKFFHITCCSRFFHLPYRK